MTKPELYADIGKALDQAGYGKGNVIFYFAIADRFFSIVASQLGKAGLTKQDEKDGGDKAFWRRVVVEKPFGHDVDSAVALNKSLLETLEEDQIFRIDHFLGKETVQSIMAFRFANGMFEPLWNRDRIDHVQITASEVVGVEARGKFYEVTGALRDMIPNHLFTLLAMVAMEPPTTFDAVGIRNRKADVFTAMPPLKPEDAVRGQYEAGRIGGKALQAYRSEPDVSPHSATETYVAMRVGIDNWRWAGVPFYLRTGKHMSARVTEIAIRFKPAPLGQFQGTQIGELEANWLVIRIQPQEGISLQFEVKKPGPGNAPRLGAHGHALQGLLRARAQRRLRDAALRCDDRRRDAVQPRRHGRGRLARGSAGAGRLERRWRAGDVRERRGRPDRGGQPAGAGRRSALAAGGGGAVGTVISGSRWRSWNPLRSPDGRSSISHVGFRITAALRPEMTAAVDDLTLRDSSSFATRRPRRVRSRGRRVRRSRTSAGRRTRRPDPRA